MASPSSIPASSSSASGKEYWTRKEDAILVCFVRHIHGDKKWRKLAKKSGLQRSGNSCYSRWMNYLRPGINNGSFTEAEHDKILSLRNQEYKWAHIARELPGRTDNDIKNYYNKVNKKVLQEIEEVCAYCIPEDQKFQNLIHETLHDKEFQDKLHEILHGIDDKKFQEMLEIIRGGKDEDNNNNPHN